MARRIVACLCLLIFSVHAAAQEPKRDFRQEASTKDGRLVHTRLIFSPEVVSDGDTLRLVRSVLATHETGTTDFRQAEPLSASTWATVLFSLEARPKEDAELLFYGSAKEVLLNGHKLAAPSKLISTGWSRVVVPVSALRGGSNEVMLKGGGSLLVEPGRAGRSYKSIDAGKTWSRDKLTAAGDVSGEYLVRLRLPQHPRQGWVMSQPIDLWHDGSLAAPRQVHSFRLVGLLEDKLDKGDRIRCFVRLGASPGADDKSWTEWLPLRRELEGIGLLGPRLLDVDAERSRLRWAQFKIVLHTTDPNYSPRVDTSLLALRWVGTNDTAAPVGKIGVKVEPPPQAFLTSSVPFVYQKPSPRLEHLRKRYRLDEVIAAGKTDMEQFMLLRYWVRNQWHTAWEGHPAGWMPPWDALIILDCKDQPECLTMCTHYGAVFTQCCQALGWNARHCILDHHCVSEVYSFQHDKWIMMDSGNSAQRADVGLHFERKGAPLSARELHLALVDRKLDGISVHFTPHELAKKIQHLCRPAPKGKSDAARPGVIPLAELKKFPVCQIENYRRYAFPGRNTYLTSLLPGELYQGFSEYFHDGYFWVGDSPDRPSVSPEYSKLLDPRREQEADWKLGGTRVYVGATGKPGEIKVDLDSLMPNHTRFEIYREEAKSAKDKPGWSPTPARFTLVPAKGETVLRVRSVNAWGKAGRESTIRIHVE
jgi:hypothetical protein